MFPFSKRNANSGKQPQKESTGKQLVKRSLALAAGLLLLWLALEIMPGPRTTQQPVVFPKQAVSGSVTTTTGNEALPIPGSQLENLANAPAERSATSFLTTGQILAVLLLASLIGFAFYWQRKKAPGPLPADALQSMGKIQLNPNQHIHLIGCGKEVLLVGTTSTQISLLHQFPITQLKQETEDNHVSGGKAPQYSTPSSTNLDDADFGLLLQHQSLLDPQSVTAKSLAATSLEAN